MQIRTATRSPFRTIQMRTKVWLGLAAGGICLLVYAMSLYKDGGLQPSRTSIMDFPTYYSAALAVRHGANPFTEAVAWAHAYTLHAFQGKSFGVSAYVYTPAFALLLALLTVLPLHAAIQAWDLANGIFLLVAVYGLLRMTPLRSKPLDVLLAATAASLLAPLRLDYYLGQADVFVFCCVACALWATHARHKTVAGILLALACITKPFMLALIVYLLWKREFKVAITAGLAFLGTLLVPFVWLGPAVWRDQLTVWSFWSHQYLPFDFNISPQGVLVRLFTDNPVTPPILVAPALAEGLWLLLTGLITLVVAAVVTASSSHAGNARLLLECGLVVTAVLFISPLTEDTYLTLLVIPALSLYPYARAWRRQSPGMRWRLASVAVILLALCVPLRQYLILMRHLWPHQTDTQSVVIFSAVYLVLLIAFFVLQLGVVEIVSGISTREAVKMFILGFPRALQEWGNDARAGFRVAWSRLVRTA